MCLSPVMTTTFLSCCDAMMVEHALAVPHVAVPAVEAEALGHVPGPDILRREADLVGEDVPGRSGPVAGQALVEPGPLLVAEELPARVELLRAVAGGVDHGSPRRTAAAPPGRRGTGACRSHGTSRARPNARDGTGACSRRRACRVRESGWCSQYARYAAARRSFAVSSGTSGSITRSGVVVLDLVVVPRGQPGAPPVSGLQLRVGLVQRVAGPVVGERDASRATADSDAIRSGDDLAAAASRPRRCSRRGARRDRGPGRRGRRTPRSSRAGQFWHDANANVSLSTGAPSGGAVRVRPTALIARPHLKRYQYQRSDGSPVISAWTVWDSSQTASSLPRRTMVRNSGSAATS